MPSPSDPSAISLRALFEQAFLPTKTGKIHRDCARSYRVAIDWLERALRRAAAIADLTAANLDKVKREIAAASFGPSHARCMTTRLRTLARFAERFGFTRPPPASGTLAHAWLTLRPQLQLAPGTLADFDAAIAELDRFRQRETLLEELSDPLLREFFRWQLRQGRSRPWAAKLVRQVRSLGRRLAPEQFTGRFAFAGLRVRRTRQLRGADQLPIEPGTLAAICRDQLLPRLAHRTRRHRHEHTAAVAQFDRFLERRATPADVTRQRLEDFAEELRARHLSGDVIDRRLWCLRRIARVADPQACPPRRQRLPDLLEPPAAGTVRHFFESAYRPLRLVGAAAMTTIEMRTTLRFLTFYAGRDVLVAELTDELVALFMEWLLARGLERVTVNSHRARLLAVWRLAAERGLIPRDPHVRKLKVDLDAPDAWSESEFAAIVAAAHQVKWKRTIAGIPAGDWWRAILLTGYWSALRCGSLLKLKRRDVDLQSGWLNVRAKITKQKRGKRFRLGDDALAALRQIWHPERELLFPLSFERRAFFRRLARIIRTAGVAPSTRRAMTLMHKLRRTTATLLAAREGIHAACELLDHSSTYVTRLYIDSSKLPGCDKTKSLPVLTGDVHQPPPRAIAATPAELVAEARQLFAVGFLRPAAGSAAAAVALHCRGQEMADPVRQLLRRLRSAAAGRQSSAARIAKLLAAAESIVSLPVSHPSLQESKL